MPRAAGLRRCRARRRHHGDRLFIARDTHRHYQLSSFRHYDTSDEILILPAFSPAVAMILFIVPNMKRAFSCFSRPHALPIRPLAIVYAAIGHSIITTLIIFGRQHYRRVNMRRCRRVAIAFRASALKLLVIYTWAENVLSISFDKRTLKGAAICRKRLALIFFSSISLPE